MRWCSQRDPHSAGGQETRDRPFSWDPQAKVSVAQWGEGEVEEEQEVEYLEEEGLKLGHCAQGQVQLGQLLLSALGQEELEVEVPGSDQ